MKNYYVIEPEGNISEIDKLDKSDKQEQFEQFVAAEINDNEKSDAEKKEESKFQKPEYLKIASKFGFAWEENSDSGLVQYNYKANFMIDLVKEYAQMLVYNLELPIYEVRGANMFDVSYPVVKAYAELYGDRLYSVNSGDKKLIMSYDASYPQFNLAGKMQLSYKDLPFAHFSISDCYRHEQSGECMMLYRQRRFNMPDLHPYFLDLGQAFEYFPKIQAKIIEACDAVNREYQMSIEVGSEKFWVENRAEILEIAKNFGKPVLCIVNNDEKDRYWIVNVDFKIVDALGKSREIACIQVDIGNAKRLGIEYLNKEGVKVNPVIIHSAVPGGIERYIYMALDNYPESFPIWLAPIQMRLLPVNKSHVEFCVNLAAQLKLKGIRVDIDDRDQSIGRKIVSAKDELIANSFVIGDKEIAGDGNMELISRNINEILENMKDKPVKHFLWPNQLSKRLG